MPAIAVNPPFPLFTDADGQPLDDAYIYIGTANQNPVSNPITVYWDSALTVTAAQPIRTSNGYPMRNGTPTRFYTNSDYSILVRDKNGAFIYTAASETDFISSEFVDFIQSGTGAISTTVQYKLRETVSVKDFGAIGDGVADDTVSIQNAINALHSGTVQGGTLFFPKGTYKVTSSIYQKPRVSLLGEGSRQSQIRWGNPSGAGLTYDAMVYCVAGTDVSPDFVFSTSIQNLGIYGNNVAPVALAIRGHQENCVFSDLLISGYTQYGLDILAFSATNHGITFEDLHIIPGAAGTGSYGIRGANVQKCNFKNITVDSASFIYSRGISLSSNPALNVFENIHTEDADYGFHITGGANNVFIGLEANGVSGACTTHFYTTATRYAIQGIRTISGYVNQLQDGINTITAGTDTDSISIVRGGNYFQRISDTETANITLGTRLTRGVDSGAGLSGNGQTYLRINDSIGTSATRYAVITLGAGSVGFSGQIKVFSTGDQRFISTAYFEGFAASNGTVSGGAVSATTGSPGSNVTIGAPAALASPTIGSIRIPIANGSPSFTQTVEIQVEITVSGRQATGISVSS